MGSETNSLQSQWTYHFDSKIILKKRQVDSPLCSSTAKHEGAHPKSKRFILGFTREIMILSTTTGKTIASKLLISIKFNSPQTNAMFLEQLPEQ